MTRTLIPEDWTPEDALGVVAFLEQVIDAIWKVHGHKMGLYLEARHAHIEQKCSTPPNREPPERDSDYPF